MKAITRTLKTAARLTIARSWMFLGNVPALVSGQWNLQLMGLIGLAVVAGAILFEAVVRTATR